MDQTKTAFSRLGWRSEDWHGLSKEGSLIFDNLEIGLSDAEQFRASIRKILPGKPTDEDIDAAWNAMLIGFPKETIAYLNQLKKQYRLFLLSNTNALHLKKFSEMFEKSFGYSMCQLFERCFYSHEIGFRKPSAEAFDTVVQEANLNPAETLFVDDLKVNTETAKSLGMQVLHIEPNTLLERLPLHLASLGIDGF